MRVIRSCIDTLEHTFSGELSSERSDELDRLKARAQDAECPQPIFLAGREFFVQAQSVRRYRWLLRNGDCLLMLRKGGVGPSMSCKLTSRGLAERGVEALWADVVEVAGVLGLAPLNLTRLDLASDFQGWVPTHSEMQNMRCRSTYRPVLPNIDNPETFYFGKAPKMLRVYNKSVEIEAKHKEWWRTVWRSTGAYVEEEPVWRCELELRSEVLKELGCRSVEDALARAASIFSWGLSETSLGEPTGDGHRSRWPEDERWTALRMSFGVPEPMSRVRPYSHLLDYEQAVQRTVGTMTSLGASLGIDNHMEIARLLFDAVAQYIVDKDTTFARLVEVKRRRASE